MTEETIIKYYKEGFSIDYITKVYYKYVNRKQKPIKVNGITLFPTKIYNKSHCRLYVCEVVYKHLINGDLARTKTTANPGRGADLPF